MTGGNNEHQPGTKKEKESTAAYRLATSAVLLYFYYSGS